MSKNSNAPSTNYEAENMNMEYTKRIFGKEFGIAYEMPYKRFSIDYGGVKTIRGDGKSRVTTVLPIIKDAFSIDRSLIGFIDIATDTEERGMLFIKAYIDPKLITFANFSSIVPSTGTMRIPIDE
jgi:hypothetical protein